MPERGEIKQDAPERTIVEPARETAVANTADLLGALASTGMSVVLTESIRFLQHRRTEEFARRQPDADTASSLDPGPEIELVRRALDMTGSPERLVRWIYAPLPALGGRVPYELMQSEEGRKEVEVILDALEYGPAYG